MIVLYQRYDGYGTVVFKLLNQYKVLTFKLFDHGDAQGWVVGSQHYNTGTTATQ